MSEIHRLTRALVAEQRSLEVVLSSLSDDQYSLATPSPGWSVIDQVSHLAYFDHTGELAIEDVAAFRASEKEMRAVGDLDAATLHRDRALNVRLDEWRTNRARLEAACLTLSDSDRVEWYSSSMGARSFISARLMECWAHGDDIRVTVAAPPSESDRLHDIALLGYNTRKWSYANRRLELPEGAVRVELTSPSAELWSFGPDDAADLISGSALEFCLVVTQRRHVDDTALVMTGTTARQWMTIAQTFAGPPTSRPPAGKGTP